MYFPEAYPEFTVEQRRSFAAAEKRLVKRLVILGCFGLAVLGAGLISHM